MAIITIIMYKNSNIEGTSFSLSLFLSLSSFSQQLYFWPGCVFFSESLFTRVFVRSNQLLRISLRVCIAQFNIWTYFLVILHKIIACTMESEQRQQHFKQRWKAQLPNLAFVYKVHETNNVSKRIAGKSTMISIAKDRKNEQGHGPAPLRPKRKNTNTMANLTEHWKLSNVS